MVVMREESVRTTVDIPTGVYRRLKARAAAEGCSVRELVLVGIRKTLADSGKKKGKRVQFPLIKSKGPKVDVTSEKIYEHIEFP